MRFLAVLLSLFVAVRAFAQGEGGYTAPPMTAFSQGLLTNVNAAGWTNALGVGGAGIATPVSIANGGTASATGNAVSLTNVSLQDGGFGDEWGSGTAMNNTLNQGPTIDSMGFAAGWGLGGDNAAIYIGHSTNFVNNGGYGCSITGSGTSGASVLARTQGPTFSYISTNETDGFVNAAGEIVFNYDAALMRIFAVVSPGGGLIGSDTMNYAGFMWDVEHHLFGVPLIPGGTTNGGCNQPDSIVWDFTATAPTNAPTFYTDGYRDSAGKVLTAYSNNAAKTHLFFTSSSAGNPVASGTLTKFSSGGASDATISYSAVAANRTWNGWAFTADNQTGNVGIFSNLTTTNGVFYAKTINSAANGVNPWSTPQTITYNSANSSGMLVQDNGGVESVSLGTRSQYVLSANSGVSADLWYAAPTVDIGGPELANYNNRGFATLNVNGSLALMNTNMATNFTATVSNEVFFVNGFGIVAITLPDATSHIKGRIYIIKDTGTTNSTILTTSSQTIDGKVGYTNAPNGSVTLQCDGAGWNIIDKYLGNPTNTATGASTGITNTWNWPATAYVSGTAIVYTNFNNAGNPVLTNTTLVNDTQAIHLQTGGTIKAASGLTITMAANGN